MANAVSLRSDSGFGKLRKAGIAALAALTLAGSFSLAPVAVGDAAADGWRRHGHNGGWHGGRDWDRRRDNRWEGAAAAGIVGLAAGALIGGAFAAPPRYAPPPVYYAPPPPPVYYQPAPSAYGPSAGAPPAGGWPFGSQGYYNYCASKYRSFDPSSGTFLGYDGYRHYCQ
jgi:hypothetical protein